MAFTDIELLMIFISYHSGRPGKQLRSGKNLNYAIHSLSRAVIFQHDPKLVLKNHTFGLFFSPPGQEITGFHCLYRGYALQRLKLFQEALLNYEMAILHPLPQLEGEDLVKRLTVLHKMLHGQKNKIKDEKTKVDLSYGENYFIPGVSSAITFAYNEIDGRHFIAQQHIRIGDVLMIQKPYAYFAIDDSNYEGRFLRDNEKYICHSCLNYTVAPFPCENCSTGTFCSIECRFRGCHLFHNSECRFPYEDDLPYQLGLRLFLIATEQNSEKVKEAIDLAETQRNCSGRPFARHEQQILSLNHFKSVLLDKLHAGERDGKFDGSSLEAVLSLPNYMEANKVTAASYAALVAIELSKKTTIIPDDVDLPNVAKFISQMIFTFAMNCLKINRNSESNMVACSIYPTISQMRHSCVANTITYNDNENIKIVRAAREIKKGEKITHSVIPQENLLTFSAIQRKSFSIAYNNMNCDCEACQNDYSFKYEIKGQLHVPEKLKEKLMKNPKDEESLWKLLKLITEKYKSPCREVKLVELGILDAVMGKINPELEKVFSALGIS